MIDRRRDPDASASPHGVDRTVRVPLAEVLRRVVAINRLIAAVRAGRERHRTPAPPPG